MTNNRKPVDEVRLSLSAAREDDSQPLHIATEGSLNQLPTKHRKGWTPAPTKPAYSQTNVSLEYKGRDYEALTKAALRKPVGYWEDAPRGMKFGGGGEKARLANAPVPVSQMSHAAAPSAPTTPPPAAKKPPVGYYEDAPHGIKFGGQPLLSASTNPHGKDVDTAEMHKGERLSIPTKLIGGPERDAIVAECRKAMGI